MPAPMITTFGSILRGFIMQESNWHASNAAGFVHSDTSFLLLPPPLSAAFENNLRENCTITRSLRNTINR